MAIFKLLWFGMALPNWDVLESKLPKVNPPPLFHENDIIESKLFQQTTKDKFVLYRDQEGLCPFSEQIWLALEVKEIDYVTVLRTQPPQPQSQHVKSKDDTSLSCLALQWPDGTIQTESLDILEKLQQEFPDQGPHYYPKISRAVDSVRCNIVRFKGVFPRNTHDTLQAPFMFRQPNYGEVVVPKSDHMVTLEETDEVLEEYFTGPFLCGAHITAADIAWAPFLERYAYQLPLMYAGNEVDARSSEYEAVQEWFHAMETLIPVYSCRIMGDKSTWQKIFADFVEHSKEGGEFVLPPDLELLPSRGMKIPTNRRKFNALEVWKQYAETRPYASSTPGEECGAYLVRNRDTLMENSMTTLKLSKDEVDTGLRELVGVLNDMSAYNKKEFESIVTSKLSGNARDIASSVESQLRTPRDMGALPAATLRTVVSLAPKPRIANASS